MLQKTLAAIARDRRCQALLAMMKKGRDRLRRGRPGETVEDRAGSVPNTPADIFRDI